MAKMGRPTKYNDKLTETICLRLAEGESLRKICTDNAMPALSSVMLWLREYQDFSMQYARARELQADAWFEEITDIRQRVDAGELGPNEARVIIDAIKWQTSKLRPQKYGDKIHVEQDRNITIEVVKYAIDETHRNSIENKPKLVSAKTE